MTLKLALLIVLLALGPACGKRSEGGADSSVARSATEANAAAKLRTQPCVNLNAADARELMSLPGIGEVIAKRVINYRERNGRFRRPEEIIIIEGFSERKYRAIAELICVE